jgi:hypothetical protein
MASYGKFRQKELLFAAVIYGAAAAVSFRSMAWWPLAAGFLLAWIVLIIVGDRSQLGHPNFDFSQFLTRVNREAKAEQAQRDKVILRASKDAEVVSVLRTYSLDSGQLIDIHAELSNHGLADVADKIVQSANLLRAYCALRNSPAPPGWTEEDRRLRAATTLRQQLKK